VWLEWACKFQALGFYDLLKEQWSGWRCTWHITTSTNSSHQCGSLRRSLCSYGLSNIAASSPKIGSYNSWLWVHHNIYGPYRQRFSWTTLVVGGVVDGQFRDPLQWLFGAVSNCVGDTYGSRLYFMKSASSIFIFVSTRHSWHYVPYCCYFLVVCHLGR